MDFTYKSDIYFDTILDIAYEKYCTEVLQHPFIKAKTKQKFGDFFRHHYTGMKCISAIKNDKCIGFILFSIHNEGDNKWCSIPVWGYGADNIQTISFLFTNLAERIVIDKITMNFSVHLYAYDTEIQRLFSYMQFGIMCEKTVRKISKIECNSNVRVRKMCKEEVLNNWDQIWSLLSQLIHHLRKSPVFYPGKEFTEGVYKDFLSDADTTVYIAEDENGMIGLIEANLENYDYVFEEKTSINVGEAFVVPQYRGAQVAQALLSFLENDLLNNQIQYDWVEHGTANPNARGFWNKYFETFEYEFIRTIEA